MITYLCMYGGSLTIVGRHLLPSYFHQTGSTIFQCFSHLLFLHSIYPANNSVTQASVSHVLTDCSSHLPFISTSCYIPLHHIQVVGINIIMTPNKPKVIISLLTP